MAKHHYLPRFYLANFTDLDSPAGQEPYVWVRSPGMEWKKRAPKNVAARAGYYSVPGPDGRMSEDVERLFAAAEGVASSVIRKKVLKQKLLNAQQRAELATFIGMMQSRVPGMIDHVGEMMAEVARRTLELAHDAYTRRPEQWEAFKGRYRHETGRTDMDEAKPEDLDPSHYKIKTETWAALGMTISGAGLYGHFLNEMDWVFFVSKGQDYFITSDYPVGIFDPITQNPSPGLAFPGIEVTFPVSRHIALLVRWGEGGRTTWDQAAAATVEAINFRTALRARLLIAPKPSFPGDSRIVTQAAAVFSGPAGPAVVRLASEPGYLIGLSLPPPATTKTK